jgi:hypothetical protein
MPRLAVNPRPRWSESDLCRFADNFVKFVNVNKVNELSYSEFTGLCQIIAKTLGLPQRTFEIRSTHELLVSRGLKIKVLACKQWTRHLYWKDAPIQIDTMAVNATGIPGLAYHV